MPFNQFSSSAESIDACNCLFSILLQSDFLSWSQQRNQERRKEEDKSTNVMELTLKDISDGRTAVLR